MTYIRNEWEREDACIVNACPCIWSQRNSSQHRAWQGLCLLFSRQGSADFQSLRFYLRLFFLTEAESAKRKIKDLTENWACLVRISAAIPEKTTLWMSRFIIDCCCSITGLYCNILRELCYRALSCSWLFIINARFKNLLFLGLHVNINTHTPCVNTEVWKEGISMQISSWCSHFHWL